MPIRKERVTSYFGLQINQMKQYAESLGYKATEVPSVNGEQGRLRLENNTTSGIIAFVRNNMVYTIKISINDSEFVLFPGILMRWEDLPPTEAKIINNNLWDDFNDFDQAKKCLNENRERAKKYLREILQSPPPQPTSPTPPQADTSANVEQLADTIAQQTDTLRLPQNPLGKAPSYAATNRQDTTTQLIHDLLQYTDSIGEHTIPMLDYAQQHNPDIVPILNQHKDISFSPQFDFKAEFFGEPKQKGFYIYINKDTKEQQKIFIPIPANSKILDRLQTDTGSSVSSRNTTLPTISSPLADTLYAIQKAKNSNLLKNLPLPKIGQSNQELQNLLESNIIRELTMPSYNNQETGNTGDLFPEFKVFIPTAEQQEDERYNSLTTQQQNNVDAFQQAIHEMSGRNLTSSSSSKGIAGEWIDLYPFSAEEKSTIQQMIDTPEHYYAQNRRRKNGQSGAYSEKFSQTEVNSFNEKTALIKQTEQIQVETVEQMKQWMMEIFLKSFEMEEHIKETVVKFFARAYEE